MARGLEWLARHQSRDGSWGAAAHVQRCGPKGVCTPNPGAESFDVGVTGLSLLALLGAGHTHLSAKHGEVVRQAIRYLTSVQDPSGRIGSDDVPKYMYNHLIAALALVEAYGLTRSAMLRAPAQKAVDYTIQAQNAGQGWRYSFRSGDNDSSVTTWGAQLLAAADRFGLDFPKENLRGIEAWYEETRREDGSFGYTDKRVGKVVIPGL